MGLRYEDLDEVTRSYMEQEVNLGSVFISPRLNLAGRQRWPELLLEAVRLHDDDWLENRLDFLGLLHRRETRTRGYKTFAVKVPFDAARQLAEGEFNRFYLRGLCVRAASEGLTHLRIYRGKYVESPREESEAKVGTLILAEAVLEDLRRHDHVETALGLPAGPNSGITARIERQKDLTSETPSLENT